MLILRRVFSINSLLTRNIPTNQTGVSFCHRKLNNNYRHNHSQQYQVYKLKSPLDSLPENQRPIRHYSSAVATKYRRNLPKGYLKTMEISQELLQQIITPEIQVLAGLFEKYGYELKLAGGAVRDLLAGKLPADIDFATTATPEEMKSMFETEQVRMINAKGEKHGTITPRINDKENFEVTTLRIDVVTDGRHAEVEFTKNWELDAARRDLTINSMFMDFNGTVYDYFNGATDLKDCRVRFVGDPVQRIQEDYLRILRYFRFYGRISPKSNDHDEETIEAIRKNMDGLKQISGERIWTEFKKILTGNYAAELTLKMLELGMGPYIGLPNDCDTQELLAVDKRVNDLKVSVNAITLLTALLRTDEEGINLNKRLKFSAFERDLCLFILLYRNTVGKELSIKSFQKIVIFSKTKIADVRCWVEEVYKYNGAINPLKEFQEWDLPKFPVTGHTLVENKVPAGRAMTKVLMEMKEIWIESNFTATAEDLITQLPLILEDIGASKSKS